MSDRLDTLQWQRLETLFDRAIGLDPAEQAELIRTIAQDDAGLAKALSSLLAADARHHARATERSDGVLQRSLAAIQAPCAAAGDRVGPYILREELGQGGMGVVFRAERADGQVRQQVALKIVRSGLLDASARERFLREREIVSAFQHPYIAHMLDVGETIDGLPFLAMELIRGVPITTYCDAHKLDTRARIGLFLRVCEAVQHAHANLVLHRDLKPSNVLVGADGCPKLIDFGIAKPLSGVGDEEHRQTATGHRFFSPSNAAPEQLRGERVGVACDVYQLGTLLYELLCGATVFDGARLTAGQLEHKILGDAPESASARAARASDATAQAHGVAKAAAWARELSGDLDAIVAHALRKLPEERYGSVEQLADDLQRCLDGRPVSARRGQRWYRTRKFLGRNALAIGLSAAALALVAAFMIALWMQSQRIARERDLAQKERNHAQQERDHAEHVAQFLTDVFKAADPADSLSRDQPIGTVLDNARKRLDAHLGDEPGQRVRMLSVLAGVYTSLDDHDTAIALLDEAQTIVDHSHDVDPRIVLAYDLQRAHLMQDSGNGPAQRDYATRALALQHSLGDSPGKQWEARVLVARSQWGRDAVASLVALQSLLQELAHNPDVPRVDYAREQINLGHDWAVAYATTKAEPLLRQGLETLEASLPPDHPDVLYARKELADLLIFNLKHPDQGATIMKDVIARQESLYGPRSSSVAVSRIKLGQAYAHEQDFPDAIVETSAACDILHQIHSRPHDDLVGCSSELGDLYAHLDGKLELAATEYAQAAQTSEAINGVDNSDAQVLRGEIASIRIRQGRLDEAERLLAANYHASSPQSRGHAVQGLAYAEVLHRLHRDAEAVALLDSVEPSLTKDQDSRRDLPAEAATLRKAIAAGK